MEYHTCLLSCVARIIEKDTIQSSVFMSHRRTSVCIYRGVVGLDGDAKDVFDAHTRQVLIHRQRYERSLTGFVNNLKVGAGFG